MGAVRRIGRPAFWEYSLYAFRFATECNRAGIRLPASVAYDKKQRRAARVLRFTYRGRGVLLRLTIRQGSLYRERDSADLVAALRRRLAAVHRVDRRLMPLRQPAARRAVLALTGSL